MPKDVIGQLRDFDLRTGKTPIDPTRIEGFSPADPPPPGPPVASAHEAYGPAVEVPSFEEPEPAPSPLVALGAAHTPAQMAPTFEAELVILDSAATYKGHPVRLSEEDVKKIQGVVIKSIRRAMDEAFVEITGKRPRQRGPKKGRKKGQKES